MERCGTTLYRPATGVTAPQVFTSAINVIANVIIMLTEALMEHSNHAFSLQNLDRYLYY